MCAEAICSVNVPLQSRWVCMRTEHIDKSVVATNLLRLQGLIQWGGWRLYSFISLHQNCLQVQSQEQHFPGGMPLDSQVKAY